MFLACAVAGREPVSFGVGSPGHKPGPGGWGPHGLNEAWGGGPMEWGPWGLNEAQGTEPCALLLIISHFAPEDG